MCSEQPWNYLSELIEEYHLTVTGIDSKGYSALSIALIHHHFSCAAFLAYRCRAPFGNPPELFVLTIADLEVPRKKNSFVKQFMLSKKFKRHIAKYGNEYARKNAVKYHKGKLVYLYQ